MTPPDPPSPGSGVPAPPSAPFGERSWTFWRGVASTRGLGPAIDGLLREFEAEIGATRTSVWIHERRARELSLLASSEPGHRGSASRVPIADENAAPARGLRLERAQILEGSQPAMIVPLRGWRRALGTLVLEGPWSRALETQQRLDLADELGRKLAVGIEN